MKRPLSEVRQRYSEHTLNHYRYMQNLLHHCQKLPKFKNIQPKIVKFCLQCYCDGDSYRTIIAKCHKKFKSKLWRRMSLRPLSQMMQRLVKFAYTWNRENPEGLLYQVSDVNISDVLITEPIPVTENKDPYLADEEWDAIWEDETGISE